MPWIASWCLLAFLHAGCAKPQPNEAPQVIPIVEYASFNQSLLAEIVPYLQSETGIKIELSDDVKGTIDLAVDLSSQQNMRLDHLVSAILAELNKARSEKRLVWVWRNRGILILFEKQ